MKQILSAIILLIALSNVTFCQQCPESGLKIQSAACESPTNLKIESVNCSVLKIKWQGSHNQNYIVKASGIDPATGNIFEVEAAKFSCDFAGNCSATVPVKSGADLTWSVQGICTEGSARLYGYQIDGGTVNIPECNATANIIKKTFKVYPNPSSGELLVDYNQVITGSLTFTIMDVSGKETWVVSGAEVSKANGGYRLDLHKLASGTYLLKISNGKETSQAKFVLMRE